MRITERILEAIKRSTKICSAKWRRRTDKYVWRCVACNADTATHQGERFCNACDAFVPTYKAKEASKGDIVQMQFIPKIAANRDAMKGKNFTGKGGNIFNADTFEQGQAILQNKGLIQCWKMGEQVPTDDANELRRMIATGEMQGVPRCFSLRDAFEISFDGNIYTDNRVQSRRDGAGEIPSRLRLKENKMLYHIHYHKGNSDFSNFYYPAETLAEAAKLIQFVNCICPDDTLKVHYWATPTSEPEIVDPSLILEFAFKLRQLNKSDLTFIIYVVYYK